MYTRDAARSGGSKHLNAERRERNAKGKTGKFSVGEGDDDLYSSKSKYDDDNDEDDIEKNKLDALAAGKRKRLEELNDDTLQKYIPGCSLKVPLRCREERSTKYGRRRRQRRR